MATPTKDTNGKTALPNFLSLVPQLDLQGIAQKVPVDRKIFMLSFAAGFVVLLAGALLLPTFIPAEKPVATEPRAVAAPPEQTKEAEAQPAPKGNYSERENKAVATNDGFANESLGPAPVDALEEPYKQGHLPRISEDGRKPWFLYSRPFDKNDPRPRIALVIADLGLSRFVSDWTIAELPGAVTLVFSSAATAVDAWMARARESGHETLLSIPMEPLDYPASDPGPGTLLVKNNVTTNMDRLKENMIKGRGYVGLTTLDGSRMMTSPRHLQPLIDEFKSRGLLFLDAQLTDHSSAYSLAKNIGAPAVNADFSIRDDMGTEALSAHLQQIEATATKNKKCVVLIAPSPLVLRQLAAWISGLAQKGFVLAPITSMAE
jgi:polysaccharide deacetylase 2 family uncharacterized protein YibQ